MRRGETNIDGDGDGLQQGGVECGRDVRALEPTAIDGMLDMWNEDEGCFVVILSDDRGVPYATMIRDLIDGELCTLTYPSGTTVRYRSHYVLDGEGRYRRTDVRVLEYRDNEEMRQVM